jgi:hypothetical protein
VSAVPSFNAPLNQLRLLVVTHAMHFTSRLTFNSDAKSGGTDERQQQSYQVEGFSWRSKNC